MRRTEAGLFIAPNFNFLRKHGRAKGSERVMIHPETGKRVRVWRDDSGTVRQIEHDERLDAIVRPEPIRLNFAARSPRARADVAARVQAIATRFRVKGTR